MEWIRESRLRRYRLARQRRVIVSRIEKDGGQYHDRLAQILRSQMIERIDIRMVHAAAIVQGILDELKGGQTYPLHEHVIRARGGLRTHH